MRKEARRRIQQYYFNARVKASNIITFAKLHKLDFHKEIRNAKMKLYKAIRCFRPRLNLLGEQYRKKKLNIKDIIKENDSYQKQVHRISRR